MRLMSGKTLATWKVLKKQWEKGRLMKKMRCGEKLRKNSGNRAGLIKQIQDRCGGKVRQVRSTREQERGSTLEKELKMPQ